MSKQKRYTADEFRDVANIWEQRTLLSSVPAMLRYAADMVERANERRGMFAANYGRIDYEVDSAIVDEIDYILRGSGNTGKETRMVITVGNEHELSHRSPHPVVLNEDELKKLHPEWFHATDYHWLDTSVKHDFWDNAFYKCDYDPIHGKYHMFAKS